MACQPALMFSSPPRSLALVSAALVILNLGLLTMPALGLPVT
ncbi:hypothetical protein Y695_04293 [Hydrogenophaga sp. T4]|nr:hypothetical protein Y695_04293 [Hydrogenophaga sp. T4]